MKLPDSSGKLNYRRIRFTAGPRRPAQRSLRHKEELLMCLISGAQREDPLSTNPPTRFLHLESNSGEGSSVFLSAIF